MCPRTSWSLSSLTLNIVLGRASVTSPSISIFSSLPIGGKRVAGGWVRGRRLRNWLVPFSVCERYRDLTALERGLSGPLGEERLDRGLKVLGLEQAAGDIRRDAIGLLYPALQIRAHDPLRRRVRLGG